MEETYNVHETESRLTRMWEKSGHFNSKATGKGKPFSMYLVPPNASGPLHVGNALMIAIQDVLARYHRAKGDRTLWIPGTDHGGYETQVTFEREIEAKGLSKDSFTQNELIEEITKFVDVNNNTIIRQIKAMGASIDWSHFRYTLDPDSLEFVDKMFKKMIADDLIYRSSYMVNYCSSCATMLADIELKEVIGDGHLYYVKFPFKNEDGYLSIATATPEFIFAVTDILVQTQDERYSTHIGKLLTNPITGQEVRILESKRKYDLESSNNPLFVFSPSSNKYDFEYAIRNGLPARNLIDWNGSMTERYLGIKPSDARASDLKQLEDAGFIDQIKEVPEHKTFFCKKGHEVQNVIRMTWFLELDGEKVSLRNSTLKALEVARLTVQPFWRKRGLVDWIGKMHNWPIARQNIWGIPIPIWYELSDKTLYTVWFKNQKGETQHGNLQSLLDTGISLEEIQQGIERVYAAEGCIWTLGQEAGKQYLPETDTFDTWFSSGAWSSMVFQGSNLENISSAYPSDVAVIGHDLLRLSIARELILSLYLTGKLPFKRVYFHSLLKSLDGQKMSKSLGNAITLDTYLDRFGADVTRMSLISYTDSKDDFIFADERLEYFSNVSTRLWKMGRVCDVISAHVKANVAESKSPKDSAFLDKMYKVQNAVNVNIDKYSLAQAQKLLVDFLEQLEEYASEILQRDDAENAGEVFRKVFKIYLAALNPFMPFLTEELREKLFMNV